MKPNRYLLLSCSLVLLTSAGTARGQEALKSTAPQIQDNSFLIEEAYNQEWGVVQHISTFSRMWNSKDWNYTFTQEWPGWKNWRHQFSYTVTGMHAGSFHGSGVGLGDTILNYRYQAVGSGKSRVAFSPRLSVLLPTGGVEQGRSTGGAGVQTNLPVMWWCIGGSSRIGMPAAPSFRARRMPIT